MVTARLTSVESEVWPLHFKVPGLDCIMERLYRRAVVIHWDQLDAPVTRVLISALRADQFNLGNV